MWENVQCIGWVDGGREGSNCCVVRLYIASSLLSPLSLLEVGHSL